MDQAGVLARPTQPGLGRQRPLDHRAGVHVGPRLELSQLFVKPCLHGLQPLQQHLVIIAWPSRAGLALPGRIHFACPGVARNPPRTRGCRIGRTRLWALVAGQADHDRARPGEGNPRPQQPPVFAPPLQVAHGARAARPHPLLEALRVPLFMSVRQRHQSSLGETGLDSQRARPLPRQAASRAGHAKRRGFRQRFGQMSGHGTSGSPFDVLSLSALNCKR
jgi:hypothetical protein